MPDNVSRILEWLSYIETLLTELGYRDEAILVGAAVLSLTDKFPVGHA